LPSPVVAACSPDDGNGERQNYRSEQGAQRAAAKEVRSFGGLTTATVTGGVAEMSKDYKD